MKLVSTTKLGRFAQITALGGAVTIGAISSLYGWLDYRANVLAKVHGLDRKQENSLKHAKAAGLITSALSKIGVSPELTEKFVLQLGYWNEKGEQVIRPGRDSTLEMIRDMANNQAGVSIALWCQNNRQEGSFDAYVSLAMSDHLFSRPEQLFSESNGSDTRFSGSDEELAIQVFKSIQPELKRKIVRALKLMQTKSVSSPAVYQLSLGSVINS